MPDFSSYLGKSSQTYAMQLELSSLSEFQKIFITIPRGNKKNFMVLLQKCWEIGYNYGYDDAQEDEGLTLAERV